MDWYSKYSFNIQGTYILNKVVVSKFAENFKTRCPNCIHLQYNTKLHKFTLHNMTMYMYNIQQGVQKTHRHPSG